MNYLDEKELITHCLECNKMLDMHETLRCTECEPTKHETCRACGITAPDVVVGLCDACDSKYGE